jgi:hypothetical protein
LNRGASDWNPCPWATFATVPRRRNPGAAFAGTTKQETCGSLAGSPDTRLRGDDEQGGSLVR